MTPALRHALRHVAVPAGLALLASGAWLDAQTPPKSPTGKPAAPAAPGRATLAAPAGPVVTIDTAKGTIVIETFPKEAPRSVEHILKLVKRRFYDGQAVHRVVAGQLVQFGDQQTRNMQLKDWWGRGPNSGSGAPIGVAEISKTRRHRRGSVSLAHPGTAASADSQMFIALRPAPAWDGKYTIIGQVTTGLEIVPKLAVGDRIKKVTVSGAP